MLEWTRRELIELRPQSIPCSPDVNAGSRARPGLPRAVPIGRLGQDLSEVNCMPDGIDGYWMRVSECIQLYADNTYHDVFRLRSGKAVFSRFQEFFSM